MIKFLKRFYKKQDLWQDLLGSAPGATGDMSSEEFIKNLRDDWQ